MAWELVYAVDAAKKKKKNVKGSKYETNLRNPFLVLFNIFILLALNQFFFFFFFLSSRNENFVLFNDGLRVLFQVCILRTDEHEEIIMTIKMRLKHLVD